MNIRQEIATARSLLERAERETDPELKAYALEEALGILATSDPETISESDQKLISNLRTAHTRLLLQQLVSLRNVRMDAWFDYIRILLVDLKSEVQTLTANDAQLRENYERFMSLWGRELADLLERQGL